MAVGQVAQGHNSAFVDEDGRAYLVYHTRTNDGTEGHQVRVHQLFTNEEGWLVTAPYEFRGEIVDKNGYDTSAIVGTYDVIVHKQSINYASLSCVTPETIQLKADGTVTGAYTGTWSVTEGTPYITIKLGNMTVKGVLVEQYVEDTVYKTMCFTGLSNTEVQVWGSKWLPAKEAVELTISTEYVKIPTSTMSDITFETEGLFGTTLTYASSNTDVLANDGTINRATEDTVVTVTVTYINGDYQDTVEYDITIVGKGEAGDRVLIAEYYTNEKINISGATEGKYQVANPFNSSVTNGLEIYNGVSIEFDVEGTGSALSNILAFYGSGRLYFTGGSYLGYNATGGYYDANLTSSYGLANDFIKGSAHIRIDLDATGYYVYANDELAYSNADVAAGTIPGSGDLTVYANVLKWLNTTAETLNFGWGNWWTDSFNGTISNVKLYANAIEEVDTSGYEYYQDYNKGLIEEWSSTNASGNLAVGNDGDAHSNYFKFSFAGDSSTNSRGAIAAFATDNAITGNYHIEMDVMLNAGNNQETQFAITTEGYAYTSNVINNGIDSGYILKLSATNSTTWSIAGTDGGTVILPDNAWVTISMDVDTEAGVAAVVISDGENVLYEGQVTMSGNGALKGIYIRAGRYQAEAAVDNIKVSYME